MITDQNESERLLNNVNFSAQHHSSERLSPTIVSLRELLRLPESPLDRQIFDQIQTIRNQAESIEGWSEVKAAAQKEVENLPGNILGLLLKSATPFIAALPAAHSKGHLARDLIHLTEIFHTLSEEDLRKYENVELLVTIFAGTFHDIGNAIVERNEERQRLSGHAEIGAFLFGHIAGTLRPPLPPNLTQLVQLAIAAHTNYQNPIPVPEPNPTTTRKPYDANVVNGNKLGMRDAQTTDRLEIRSAIQIVRHIVSMSTQPNDVFINGTFRVADTDQQEDFARHFSLDQNESTGILQFLQKLVRVEGEPPNHHTKQDTSEIAGLFIEKEAGLQSFIDAVQADAQPLDKERVFQGFLRLCGLLEPGSDIDYKMHLLKEKFSHFLPQDLQDHWLMGFQLLTDRLYPQLYYQMQQRIGEIPQAIQTRGKVIVDIYADLQKRAHAVLDAQNPDLLLGNPPYPDLLNALVL